MSDRKKLETERDKLAELITEADNPDLQNQLIAAKSALDWALDPNSAAPSSLLQPTEPATEETGQE